MTAYNYLPFLATALILVAWAARVCADDDVSVHHASSSSSSATPGSGTTQLAPDGTPVIHKSLHRKRKKVLVASGDPASNSALSVTISAPLSPSLSNTAASAATAPVTVKSTTGSEMQITISDPTPAPGSRISPGAPEVETGLPVARHGTSLGGDESSFLNSSPGSLPSGRRKTTVDNITFTDFNRRVRNVYPWKYDIMTTKFWIGEGSSPISSTTNVASAWDEDWRHNNGGSDAPDDRDSFLPSSHAARLNPFYVALPFNDLAFPDKARRWLPSGWYRPMKDGKQVSACKDRWVEIKNEQGRVCFAQWEDVGPLRYDHAEYVFGDERPDTYTSEGLNHAGLDVSPAVADYLNITGKNCITRWRFVDDSDVQPGEWLKLDEEALLFKAMHEMKNDPTRVLPIQKSAAPIDDGSDIESNQRRVGAAKG